MSVRFQHNDDLILFLSLLFYDYPKAQTLALNQYSSLNAFKVDHKPFIQGLRLGNKRKHDILSRYPNIDIKSQEAAIQSHCDGIIRFTDPHYPLLLKELYDPPVCLYYKGNPDLLSTPILAIVGTRVPNDYGRQVTQQFCEILAPHLTICSGMALGIDGIAHQQTLAQSGQTIAFLGSGVDICYPKSHKKLYDEICQRGLVISEFPCMHPIAPPQFPQRNRLITSISQGTLVTQAQLKSGSLVSARLAVDAHREVFVIPNAITDPMSEGTHSLLKEGAHCVTHPEDILQILALDLSPETGKSTSSIPLPLITDSKTAPTTTLKTPQNLSSDEERLWNSLTKTPQNIDTLQLESGLELSKMLQLITLMELKEYITLLPGSKVKKGQDYD